MKIDKRFIPGIGLGLLIMGARPITVHAQNNTKLVQTYKQSMLYIDSPHGDYDVNSTIKVQGWALNNSGTKQIEILVNGVKQGNADLNIYRPDVNQVFPGYIQKDYSGFEFNIESNSLGEGVHHILVYLTANDGEITTSSVTITISKKPSLMQIDLSSHAYDYHENISFEGWALNSAGTKKVEVIINNTIYNADINIERKDVNLAIPGYPQENRSGYFVFIEPKSIPVGEHLVEVVVVDNDDNTYSMSKKLTVIKKEPKLVLDSIYDNLNIDNQNIDIHGWFINMGGTKNIQILLNDQPIGNATLNIYRPDVAHYFPGYTTDNSAGFKFSIDKNIISPGAHKISIIATSNEDETIQQDFNITMNKPIALTTIDFPRANTSIQSNSITISGWALNPSIVKTINFYLDDVLIETATVGESRFDVVEVFPDYPEASTSGFSYTLNLDNMIIGDHQIKVEAIGYDGSVNFATTNFSMFGYVNTILAGNTLDHYVNSEYQKGSAMVSYLGGWVNASYEDIYYYMNPINFINDKQYRYMFMKLNYTEGIFVDDLNKVLSNAGILSNTGNLFLEAGKKANVNPIYLVAHARLETGNGTSNLAQGVVVDRLYDSNCNVYQTVTPTVVYNFFGIGAIDNCAVNRGATTAYLQGWTTPEKAIDGGAEWIAKQYINNSFQQDTLYKMRYNFEANWKQYATDIAWAKKQTSTIMNLVEQMDNSTIYFEVPLFLENK